MNIGERIGSATDSLGTAVLWIPAVVSAIVATFGEFTAVNLLNGSIVFAKGPDVKAQVPWFFVVVLTVVFAVAAKALLRSSDTMWRSWLFRLGFVVALMSVIIFLVADAQVKALEYLYFRDDGTVLRPAFPYSRASFDVLSLVGSYILLIVLRRRGH